MRIYFVKRDLLFLGYSFFSLIFEHRCIFLFCNCTSYSPIVVKSLGTEVLNVDREDVMIFVCYCSLNFIFYSKIYLSGINLSQGVEFSISIIMSHDFVLDNSVKFLRGISIKKARLIEMQIK